MYDIFRAYSYSIYAGRCLSTMRHGPNRPHLHHLHGLVSAPECHQSTNRPGMTFQVTNSHNIQSEELMQHKVSRGKWHAVLSLVFNTFSRSLRGAMCYWQPTSHWSHSIGCLLTIKTMIAIVNISSICHEVRASCFRVGRQKAWPDKKPQQPRELEIGVATL